VTAAPYYRYHQNIVRILFCNYEYPPLGGGGGVVMAALARELAKRHEVTVLTSRAVNLPSVSDEGGVRIFRVPVFFRKELATANFASMLAYLPTGMIRGLRLRPGANFDVVNTHFVVPTGPVGQVLSSVGKIPNVLSVHGGDLFDPSKSMSPHRHWWLRAPIASLLRSATAVVGQSKDTNRHVSEIYGVKRDVGLIPLGIERPPQPEHSSRAQFGIPANACVMVTIGRQVPRKNTPQLVRTLADPRLSSAHLVIVGDGPEIPEIRRVAAEVGVSDRLHLLGMVSEETKYRALQVSDIFVSTSQHEGFGLVFLEAMAFGLPVVCYDRGGQVDFLTTGVTGHVVKLNDFSGFTDAVVRLAASNELRDTIRATNLQLVESFFIDKCAERYETLFKAVIAGAGSVGSPQEVSS
jgi:glycosyltransferase involved in cell wall biosynthesis